MPGYAVVHARAVTMTPVWYASAEWHLYGRELDPDAFRLADKNLRLKKRVTAGFRCNVELR